MPEQCGYLVSLGASAQSSDPTLIPRGPPSLFLEEKRKVLRRTTNCSWHVPLSETRRACRCGSVQNALRCRKAELDCYARGVRQAEDNNWHNSSCELEQIKVEVRRKDASLQRKQSTLDELNQEIRNLRHLRVAQQVAMCTIERLEKELEDLRPLKASYKSVEELVAAQSVEISDQYRSRLQVVQAHKRRPT